MSTLPKLDLAALPGPENIYRIELDNGLTVLSRPNYNSPSVVIGGYMNAGSLQDPDDKLGLADFTAAALMRGSQTRSFQETYDALESAGASLGVSSGVHTTGFSGKALVEDLDLLLELLASAMRQPTFPAEQVERLRAQILTGLAIRAQDTGEMASLLFDQVLYPGHPYSRPEEGTAESIQSIQPADLAAFQQRCYGPRGMVIAVVGGVEPQLAAAKVAAALGDWRNPAQPDALILPPAPRLSQPVARKTTIPGKSQADFLLGCIGPSRYAPDYVAAVLGNSVLGQFGMYGRIGEAVREKAGLAYYAYSGVSGGLGPGPWYAAAGVDPVNLERAIALTRAEIERFVSEPVSADDLADCQAQFIGSLPLSLESNGGVVGALLNLERFSLGLDYYRRYPDLIGAVTPEQTLDAARHYLDPARLGTAVAGP